MHTLDTLPEVLARHGALIQDEVRRALRTRRDADAAFYGMMRYHLGLADERLEAIPAAGGKGLRGSLLILTTEAVGGDIAAAVPFAAGIELLHNFSLVHDDIQDSSPTRRHRPTVWTLWGAPLAINVGDGLYALAHQVLFNSSLRRTAPERFIDLLRVFEEAALRLCEGQHRDMSFESEHNVSVEAYLDMIGGKSAALIAAAAGIGVRAGAADEARAAVAYRFGYQLGMAFQMQDDILGIWGDEAVTGKSAVSDITSRKKTLPVLLAMDHAAPDDRARLQQLYAGRPTSETSPERIRAILDRAGARDLVGGYLQRFWSGAMSALHQLGLTDETRARLETFARSCIERVA